ncbi:MAG: LemA family protein [Pseudomonadota bacterium]
MSRTTFITIVIFILIVIAGICIVKYNHLASLDEAVEMAWNPLEGKLKERYASIPRLVPEVTLYVGHEVPEVKDLANIEPSVTGSSSIQDKVTAANKLEKDLTSVMQMLSERYPGIISGHQFDVIIKIRQNTDKTIGNDVKKLNDAVTEYNTYVRRFPNDLVALILVFPHKYEYFQPEE